MAAVSTFLTSLHSRRASKNLNSKSASVDACSTKLFGVLTLHCLIASSPHAHTNLHLDF